MNSSLIRAATLPLALLACAGLGCRTQGEHPPTAPMANAHRDPPEALPAWVEEPFGAEREKHMAMWLGEQDPAKRGFWQVEAELELAVARLAAVQQETKSDRNPSQDTLLASRARNARAALEKIARDESADDSQQQRAQDALAGADRLLAQLGQPRAALGVPVIARASWGAAPARPALMIKNSGGWKRITVHHSAEAEPAPLDGSAESSAAALRLIQRSHLKGKTPPWGDIGYHYLIDPDGRVFQGRDLAWQGAHAKGENNVQNIGICLLGNFDEEHPTAAALESLRKLLDSLRQTYRIARSEVHKHAEFRNTDCPGKFLRPWVDEYRKGAGERVSAAAK
jgi:hypothetical protein